MFKPTLSYAPGVHTHPPPRNRFTPMPMVRRSLVSRPYRRINISREVGIRKVRINPVVIVIDDDDNLYYRMM